MTHQEKTLTRDCKVVLIPSGQESELPAGSPVIITQTLGGTFTVATQTGLARIAAEDADALGYEKKPEPQEASKASGGGAIGRDVDEKDVWTQLKNVYDPEIPVNIVDLGLVYSVELTKSESGGTHVHVKMTLTAPGCGMGPTIAADARSRVLTVPGVESAEVELVWSPPWHQGMITEPGKMKLGMI